MKASIIKSLYSVNHDNESKLLLDKEEVADSILRRMRGLLWRDGFTQSDGMLITPCNYVHTIGMRFNIDLIFLCRDKKVIGYRHNMKKNRFAGILKAKHTLELPAGKLKALKISLGDKLCW